MAKEKANELISRDAEGTHALVEKVKRVAQLTQEPEDTVFVWPDLLYNELIPILGVTVILALLSIFFNAPLEEMASTDTTPNPMKAPWYFVGLQELLVFFDPWIAGVVLPGMIIVGLLLIPYIDPNPRGVGYYTFSERKLAVAIFVFGLALWYIMIIIGVWMRGLDWQWYWPWDDWTLHKSLSGVKLGDLEVGLQNLIGMSPAVANLATYLIVIGYYVAGFSIPFLFFKKLYKTLGVIRYNFFMFFFLSMMGVPIKIFLRLLFNIKYVLVTPWFNI